MADTENKPKLSSAEWLAQKTAAAADHGQRVIYAKGRGAFVAHEFAPGEPVPQVHQRKKKDNRGR